jgi:chorismate dehydratase
LNNRKVKISIVNYYNTLPFRWALKNASIIEQIDLQEDIPSICAQKLKFNQVDIGLVPVALLPELDSYRIITDYCIGANGKVDSVKLYSSVNLNEVKSITLDYQSKSSITLTKVLAKEFWNIKPEFIDAKPGFENSVRDNNAIIVIGDRTFDLNGTYKFEWDLSEEWKKFTGLPFVFAAWVINSTKVSDEFIKEFNAVLEFAVKNIPLAIQADKVKLPSVNLNAEDYLTKKIDYHLDATKKEALNLFLEKIKALNL